MLDKGIVIDAWVRISLVGIDLITVEARVVVASIDTYLKGVSPQGPERLTVRSISRIVRTIALAKGLSHIHPHSLRHGFGQHTFDHDGSLPAIQRLMGHSRLTTTAGFYVDGSVPRIMREIRKAHPHAS